MNTVVRLDGATKRYGDFAALDALSLQVEPGEILGLLGHNGAGKTTTMKLVLGIIEASAGQVLLFGQQPYGEQAYRLRRRVGYLPENISLYDQLTGREVLDYFGRLKGTDRTERERLLERVGLAEAADRRVRTYSKGMRQRLGLAQALLGKPQLLMLDEPTAGLDPMATREFYAMLDEHRRQGTTVIISSHVLPGIEQHINRAAILGHGQLLAAGTLHDLWQRAGLPIMVRATCDYEPQQPVIEDLTAVGASVDGYCNGGLDMKIDASDKLLLLQRALKIPGLTDLEVHTPSLESVYAYYNEEAS